MYSLMCTTHASGPQVLMASSAESLQTSHDILMALRHANIPLEMEKLAPKDTYAYI